MTNSQYIFEKKRNDYSNMTQNVFDFEEKKEKCNMAESFPLHVHFICVGLNRQRKGKKKHSVITALKNAIRIRTRTFELKGQFPDHCAFY